jgi:hypothetical protein
MGYYWDKKPELKSTLETAGWRYAQLVGIVNLKTNLQASIEAGHDMNGDIEIASFIESDKKAYGHFVKTIEHNGKVCPIWDEAEAATFVSEVAGVSKKVAKDWLGYDWP